MPDTLYIFGARSTAIEIAELAKQLHPEMQLIHVIGDDEEDETGGGVIRISELGNPSSDAFGIISMANPKLRETCVEAMKKAGLKPMSLIHPDATISPSAKIGSGSYIAAGCRVSSNARVGEHSMLNLNVTFGHDAVCGKHCVINPGAAISGNVTIGDRVLIGANSFVHQGKAIGDDCQVDAMSHVWRDLPAGHVATSRSLRVDPRIDLGR